MFAESLHATGRRDEGRADRHSCSNPSHIVERNDGKTQCQAAAVVLYVLALVAVVVGVDVLFFRHQFWERLIANVGIVLVFAAFYWRFFKRP